MMEKFIKYYGYQWLAAFALGILLPFSGRITNMSGLHKVIFFYMLLNSIYTLYLGYQVRKRGYSPLVLLFLPVLFTVISTLLLDLVSHEYGFYFGLMYIVLSLFTFFGDTRDDPDENQIPVEAGFHNLSDSAEDDIQLPVDGGFKS